MTHFKLRILAIAVICAFSLPGCGKKEPVAPPVSVFVGWEENFNEKPASGMLPGNWTFRGKPGISASKFSVETLADGDSFLHMVSNSSTGTVLCNIEDIDLSATPILEWRWRIEELPAGGDARDIGKDDQAIGIYVGTGSMLAKKAIAYHWDTDTPKMTEGESRYGANTIRVKWITLRNKDDVKNEWVTEKRNCAEDFKKAWGFLPGTIYLSVASNSQYNKSKAEADLDWIRFTSGEK